MASFSVRIVAALLSSSAVAPTLDCTGGGTAGGALTVTNTLAQSITILTCGEDSCTTPSYARCTPPYLAAGETATLSLLPAQHYVAFVYNASFEQECWPSEPGAFPSDSIRLPMADPRLACETAPPPSPGGGCDGTVIKQRQLVWNPNAPSPYATHSLKWNQSEIVVYPTSPVVTQSGWTVAVGPRGLREFADPALLQHFDALAVPWAAGLVDAVTGVPTEVTGGYLLSTAALHEDWSGGLDPTKFLVSTDKMSYSSNVDIVADTVDGVQQNVLRLTARTVVADEATTNTTSGEDTDDVSAFTVLSSAMLQTTQLFGSGRYEIKARVPQAQGLVWGMWVSYIFLSSSSYD